MSTRIASGFRFVVFVNRRPRAELVLVLRERLERRATRIETALQSSFASRTAGAARDPRRQAEISVYRTDGVRSLFGAEVELDVFGENLMPAYTEGDSRLVVATDTMKNLVHATTQGYDGSSIEELIELIGARFLETYEHFERIQVRAREVPFERRERCPLPTQPLRRRRRRARARPFPVSSPSARAASGSTS